MKQAQHEDQPDGRAADRGDGAGAVAAAAAAAPDVTEARARLEAFVASWAARVLVRIAMEQTADVEREAA